MPTIEQLKLKAEKAEAAIKAARQAKQKADKELKKLSQSMVRKRALEIGMIAREHGLFEWTNEEIFVAFKALSRPQEAMPGAAAEAELGS